MNSKLREILKDYALTYAQLLRTPTIEAKNLAEFKCEEAEKAIRKAVAEEMLELVGKDEKNPGIRKHIFAETFQGKRNKLRAELRQKIKEWEQL